MLFVKVEVRPSPIQGVGIFAVEPIPAGTLVSRWTPMVDREFMDCELDWEPGLREFVERYGWRERRSLLWRVTIDHAKFTNHSKAPNLRHVEDAAGDSMVAARDIAAGEEITEDYSTFDPDFDSYAGAWESAP